MPEQFEPLHFHSEYKPPIESKTEQSCYKPPKYDLDTLLKNINHKNLHSLIFEDGQKGNEQW
jgi:hypothetical protein